MRCRSGQIFFYLFFPPKNKKRGGLNGKLCQAQSILNHNAQCSCLLLLMLIFVCDWLFTLIQLFRRTLFGSVRDTGLTKANTTRLVQRLASIHKRPNYRRTGTHPFPRSVSVWRLTDSWGSPLSTARLPLFTLWLLMVSIGLLHWVGTSGKSWLIQGLVFSSTATRKDSIPRPVAKQESESLGTTKTTAVQSIETMDTDVRV